MYLLNARQQKLYLTAQFGGWFAYVSIAFFLHTLRNDELNPAIFISFFSVYIIGIGLSHLFRSYIISNNWLTLSIVHLIPRVLLSSILLGILTELLYILVSYFFVNPEIVLFSPYSLQETAGWAILYLLWSLLYFIFHFFKNYKNEEIKNLRFEALKSEIELNKLKSQLNPHFLFNSMNSIRALIDENPTNAKNAVTQLSNILRISLSMSSFKRINFKQELKLVEDYLALEKVRYENRLTIAFYIDPKSDEFDIPPMMLQTLVENGIKHGISKLPKGGIIKITSIVEDDLLCIEIINSGKLELKENDNQTYGLQNTKERLKLLYGERGSFSISQLNQNEVITHLKIPKSKQDD